MVAFLTIQNDVIRICHVQRMTNHRALRNQNEGGEVGTMLLTSDHRIIHDNP